MSDYPMLISNKLHSFRNFMLQIYKLCKHKSTFGRKTSILQEAIASFTKHIS